MNEGEVTTKEMSPYHRSLEMKRAQRHIEYVLRLSDKDGRGDEASLAEARETLRSLQATDMAGASLLSNMPGEAALVLWNRSRRALHALAPVVLMRLADKIDNENAPGSERTLLAVAKGLGLLVPGAPQDGGEREAQITKADLADVPTDELRRRLLAHADGDE